MSLEELKCKILTEFNEKFPMLEISEYYCHRHKYAIVNLKMKSKN